MEDSERSTKSIIKLGKGKDATPLLTVHSHASSAAPTSLKFYSLQHPATSTILAYPLSYLSLARSLGQNAANNAALSEALRLKDLNSIRGLLPEWAQYYFTSHCYADIKQAMPIDDWLSIEWPIIRAGIIKPKNPTPETRDQEGLQEDFSSIFAGTGHKSYGNELLEFIEGYPVRIR